MKLSVIWFTDLLLVALLAGTMFGIWIGFNPAGLSSAAYVEQQQHTIRALNVLLPTMGGIGIVLTIVLTIFGKGDARARYLLAAAVACLAVSGVITRFLNQPINSEVMTWTVQSPPANWTALRDEWWKWHVVRTCSGIAALGLLISAALFRHSRR